MKHTFVPALLALALGWPAPAAAEGTFESVLQSATPVVSLKRILLPFVATCDREKTHFRKLFCSALNERLKSQHQSKMYRATFEPSTTGPLLVAMKTKPAAVELTVRGCLTCKQPLLERKGGDISKGRFFLFKTPEEITTQRGLYDLGEITMATYRVDLPAKMDGKRWVEEVQPFLRLDLLFRPVAGVTMVGKKRYKYGVITFELVGHRVYDRCSGKVYGVSPAMSGKYLVNKKDMTCPQNQPKKVVARPRLPSALPQASVRQLMEQVSEDVRVCYEMFGETGDAPTEIVVAPDGKVKSAKVTGKLAGSPAAACVERLIRETSFPRFTGAAARLTWPIALRH